MNKERELARLFRELADLFEELADIEENNELDKQQKEEMQESVMPKIIVKSLKIKAIGG